MFAIYISSQIKTFLHWLLLRKDRPRHQLALPFLDCIW